MKFVLLLVLPLVFAQDTDPTTPTCSNDDCGPIPPMLPCDGGVGNVLGPCAPDWDGHCAWSFLPCPGAEGNICGGVSGTECLDGLTCHSSGICVNPTHGDEGAACSNSTPPCLSWLRCIVRDPASNGVCTACPFFRCALPTNCPTGTSPGTPTDPATGCPGCDCCLAPNSNECVPELTSCGQGLPACPQGEQCRNGVCQPRRGCTKELARCWDGSRVGRDFDRNCGVICPQICRKDSDCGFGQRCNPVCQKGKGRSKKIRHACQPGGILTRSPPYPTCPNVYGEGEVCGTLAACAPGFYCSQNNKCKRLGELGDRCGEQDDLPCGPGLKCIVNNAGKGRCRLA